MINSKQRSTLRAMAHSYEVIVHIGKEQIGPTLIKQVEDALQAREMIKLTVLRNSPYSAREACDVLAEATGADPVSVIGNRFVLYRPSKENPTVSNLIK